MILLDDYTYGSYVTVGRERVSYDRIKALMKSTGESFACCAKRLLAEARRETEVLSLDLIGRALVGV